MRKHVIISGLRRSGTTIFWEVLRSHSGVTGIDEPFHPKLVEGDRSNKKGTWDDLAKILKPFGPLDPVCIEPLEELESVLSGPHKAYFADVLDAHDTTVVDVVRCWNHASELTQCSDNAVFIHMIRGVRGWVQAHLLPTGPRRFRKRVADTYRKATFFRRRGYYNNYHYQTIIDASLQQRDEMWRFSNMSVDALIQAPAFVKLMAFWWCANATTFLALKEGGHPSKLVFLEDFSHHPKQVLNGIADLSNWDRDEFNTGQVKPIRAPYGSKSRKWQRAADAIGIPKVLLSENQLSSDAVQNAFETALKGSSS